MALPTNNGTVYYVGTKVTYSPSNVVHFVHELPRDVSEMLQSTDAGLAATQRKLEAAKRSVPSSDPESSRKLDAYQLALVMLQRKRNRIFSPKGMPFDPVGQLVTSLRDQHPTGTVFEKGQVKLEPVAKNNGQIVRPRI